MRRRRSRFLPVAPLLLGLSLMGQDLQLGLDRQYPRSLDINPPTGFLHLDSAPSWALSLRFSHDLWAPREGQALEGTAGFRLPSERQLTYRNSAGAAGDVSARQRLELQPALGALFRFDRPFGLPLAAGLGLEARRERLILKDGGLESAGTLTRVWLRGVLRHRFCADGFGPFLALEGALPLSSAPTPSGVDYLADLDNLGQSSHPGTAAKAHAPGYGLVLAVGYRFGRLAPAALVRTLVAPTTSPTPAPVPPMKSAPPRFEAPLHPAMVPAPQPQADAVPLLPVPAGEAPVAGLPSTIVLDEAALHFALDRSDIPPQGIVMLKAWARRIKALPCPPLISLVGHSDATGPRAHNVRLSRARAIAAARVLRAEGLAVARIEGLGPDEPLETNDTVEGRARNRRVEIHLESEGIDVRNRTHSNLVAEPAGLKANSRRPQNSLSKSRP